MTSSARNVHHARRGGILACCHHAPVSPLSLLSAAALGAGRCASTRLRSPMRRARQATYQLHQRRRFLASLSSPPWAARSAWRASTPGSGGAPACAPRCEPASSSSSSRSATASCFSWFGRPGPLGRLALGMRVLLDGYSDARMAASHVPPQALRAAFETPQLLPQLPPPHPQAPAPRP